MGLPGQRVQHGGPGPVTQWMGARVWPMVELVAMSIHPLTVSQLGEYPSLGAVRLGRVGQVRDVA